MQECKGKLTVCENVHSFLLALQTTSTLWNLKTVKRLFFPNSSVDTETLNKGNKCSFPSLSSVGQCKCASQPSFSKECPLALSLPALHDDINHVLILPKSRVTVIRQLNGHREVNHCNNAVKLGRS